MLLAAMADAGKNGVGIDVSMTWMVVAKRLIEEHGGQPVLAAAMAEALPLREETISGVISLDVIEHVRDPEGYLAEINRVVKQSGMLAVSTPNRFSLTAEPHVFIWGVGWLPQRWQKGFVAWRSGKSYDDTVLMSSARLGRLVRRNTDFAYRIVIPEVPPEHIAAFAKPKAMAARLYNWLAGSPLFRLPFLAIGPFFRVTGTKMQKGQAI
jgi:2-polyprenyl-3-methyl-5-hydroxy-6-metoxy-1,4-benzoquinol methylase